MIMAVGESHERKNKVGNSQEADGEIVNMETA